VRGLREGVEVAKAEAVMVVPGIYTHMDWTDVDAEIERRAK
jgi:hypothetical protein